MKGPVPLHVIWPRPGSTNQASGGGGTSKGGQVGSNSLERPIYLGVDLHQKWRGTTNQAGQGVTLRGGAISEKQAENPTTPREADVTEGKSISEGKELPSPPRLSTPYASENPSRRIDLRHLQGGAVGRDQNMCGNNAGGNAWGNADIM